MDVIQRLFTRFRNLGVLLIIGFILIVYIALGFVYFQQGAQQKEIQEKINQLNLIVNRPLVGGEELRAEYDAIQLVLAPITNFAAVEMLVNIAEDSGIDVDEDTRKLRITPAISKEEIRGGTTYQVLSFKNVSVQGDYESVVAFIAALDSDETPKTIVLTKIDIRQVKFVYTGEEGQRRAEFRTVQTAVAAMMEDNNLSEIPGPIDFASGVASNLMGDNPDTEGVVEGFPDISTTIADKGYMGADSPRGGYVLYMHDRIDPVDNTRFRRVNYSTSLSTTYYYTCESSGVVRQFDGTDVFSTTEFIGAEESKMETLATIDLDIYTRP
jgi:hypothetical protein